MSILVKPMLAAKLTGKETLRFPLLASPKLDGVRALIQGGQALSRNLKPIPNKDLQHDLSMLPTGLDGELVIPSKAFCDVTSAVMGRDNDSQLVEYWVFDNFMPPTKPFVERAASLHKLAKIYPKEAGPGGWVRVVPQLEVQCAADVTALEERWLSEGYEGIILRAPEAPYKEGRSTVMEQGLLKLKRFCDSEAEILETIEQIHNGNPSFQNEVGHTKRSTRKAGKTGKNVLGSLRVRDLKTGVEFEIGSGFTDEQRMDLWKAKRVAGKMHLVGMIVKYRHQESGAKDKPRFPTFVGFRDERDL
jgi:DNA ligase 1